MEMILQDQGQRRCRSSWSKTLHHLSNCPSPSPSANIYGQTGAGGGGLLWRDENGEKELNKVTKDPVSAWEQAKDWHQLSCWRAVTQLSYFEQRSEDKAYQWAEFQAVPPEKGSPGKNPDSARLVRWKTGRPRLWATVLKKTPDISHSSYTCLCSHKQLEFADLGTACNSSHQ